mmetsp:Transcript_37115/g.56947  ORF Transcript_37115/g.56947 Transcript_37115/m.56947 type:complete len:147 (+) Transcript_37115:187-627(+)|eukprot:CAMPEP_0170503342 /NCGR_PEP_ID=MMETSP0208-20121228/44402_1 /TAXON_ID=197538 /ORGANISM="Strombidium inclinatum, Strain S3" /LENGTH=146 /DNA_ID=CAMNT_0010782935 /DNA_START=138 /DNA_END=578 /DNA_ORIENTATION=-
MIDVGVPQTTSSRWAGDPNVQQPDFNIYLPDSEETVMNNEIQQVNQRLIQEGDNSNFGSGQHMKSFSRDEPFKFVQAGPEQTTKSNFNFSLNQNVMVQKDKELKERQEKVELRDTIKSQQIHELEQFHQPHHEPQVRDAGGKMAYR